MSANEDVRFAICVQNEGYPASLEVRKLYQVVLDPDATRNGEIRVIDESGEDYLYPSDYFLTVALPQSVEQALLKAS